MELIIKIPEHIYENNIKNDLPIYLSEENIVKILPKGHGRLIDADELTENNLCKTFGLRSVDIENVPTIIEADKAESEVSI